MFCKCATTLVATLAYLLVPLPFIPSACHAPYQPPVMLAFLSASSKLNPDSPRFALFFWDSCCDFCSSFDWGQYRFGRCIVLRKYTAMVKKYANRTMDRVVAPVTVGQAPGRGRTALLDRDGIAAVGEIINPGDIYVNKQSPVRAGLS